MKAAASPIKEYLSSSPEETLLLGEEIGKSLAPGSIVTLKGQLGAGKTVFAGGIARALGITETITSPTYTIINEYGKDIPLYHIDTYRLAGDDDFILTGAEELLYGQGICIIEWPERLSLLPEDKIFAVEIIIMEDGKRKILCKSGKNGEHNCL
jgi:tRNA threonylcarbamoyladenosine biosynthesis protein TsaE